MNKTLCLSQFNNRSGSPLFKFVCVLSSSFSLVSGFADIPQGTNNWPWNVNPTNNACTDSQATYIIARAQVDTPHLIGAASGGAGGRAMGTRMEMSAAGPVVVLSLPDVGITGAVEALGANPMIIAACESIR